MRLRCTEATEAALLERQGQLEYLFHKVGRVEPAGGAGVTVAWEPV